LTSYITITHHISFCVKLSHSLISRLFPYTTLFRSYVAEVDKNKMAADPYYVRGDYVGKSGVELSHEEDLRGEKGVEVLLRDAHGDRKSTRLNSSHVKISYAVFCLKKKIINLILILI